MSLRQRDGRASGREGGAPEHAVPDRGGQVSQVSGRQVREPLGRDRGQLVQRVCVGAQQSRRPGQRLCRPRTENLFKDGH